MRLPDRVALITGGNSGIGEATAALFTREGARVAITGRDKERGQKVAREIGETGGEIFFMRSDVRRADDCRSAVDQTLLRYGRLDILFNNAGVFYPRTVPEWQRGRMGPDHRS